MARSNIIRWKVKNPFDPSRGLIRMSWNKYNLYALATRTRPEDLTRKSVYQQKWTAKRELRAYHVPNITERQLTQRHWSVKLPLQQLTQDEKDRLPPVQALAFAETERRLDVVVFRSHFASSLWMARASVVQGHVMVNGDKCDLPARRLEDGDLVTVSPSVVPTLKPATDSSSPSDFAAVPYQAPWMFLPAYLEVDYATCSTVFLRSPLPQPDQVEVPSPFPPEWHQLAYEWYSGIVKKKEGIRTNFELKPKPVVEGIPIKMKQKFAEIRERDVKTDREKKSAVKRDRERTKSEKEAATA
ncbi:mitochondrial 37S ribosomal protein nam9 [Geranomyces variabilis]|nr:mitochondrial 37S ribosomal protein nam9 [Geranomyces variabilis]